MNPLTQIKNTQKISKQEILQGVPESASWHARYKHSAYIYAGGLPFDLTEGDVLTVFAQYGELVDVHNVKDRDTGKYRGFSFLAYEDQRSTVLAVDNLNGATVGGRTVRVEHVDNYKKKKAEVEGREESESEQDEQEPEGLPAPPSQAAAVLPLPPSAGGKGDMPWAAAGSIFSMLNDSAAVKPSAVSGHQLPPRHKSRKKDKKDKKHTRHKEAFRDDLEAQQSMAKANSFQAVGDAEDVRYQSLDHRSYGNGAAPPRARDNKQSGHEHYNDMHTTASRHQHHHADDTRMLRDSLDRPASSKRQHSRRESNSDQHDSRKHSTSRHASCE